MNRLAQPRISWRSIAYKRSERFPDVETDYQIGGVVLFGRFVIDNDQLRAAVPGHQRKTCGGPNDQRRSDRQEQVALLSQFSGAAHCVFRHRLSERDRRGLHRILAEGAVGGIAGFFETRFYPRKIIGMSATDAAGIGGVAM